MSLEYSEILGLNLKPFFNPRCLRRNRRSFLKGAEANTDLGGECRGRAPPRP